LEKYILGDGSSAVFVEAQKFCIANTHCGRRVESRRNVTSEDRSADVADPVDMAECWFVMTPETEASSKELCRAVTDDGRDVTDPD
jgi:hypothetical protein